MAVGRPHAARRGAGRVCAIVILSILPHAGAQVSSPTTQHAALIPARKGIGAADLATLYRRGTQRIYRGAARTTIGMPCGGIGAGQLYVLGDGTLGKWDIDGQRRFSGHGADSYRTYRPEQPIAQGFALGVVDSAGNATSLTLDDAGYDAIEFVGEYPVARIRYRSRAQAAPPVHVDLEVFSPFIPLDARASAYPATVLRFTVANWSDGPVEVALGGWLENMAGREAPSSLTIKRRNRCVTEGGLASVLMDVAERRPPQPDAPVVRVLHDFEAGSYAGWAASGEAFGQQPADGKVGNQNDVTGFEGEHLVNSYASSDQSTGRLTSTPFRIELPYITFLLGGGQHPGQTCLNLVIDDKVVRSATGRNREQLTRYAWDVSGFTGQEARFEIVDEHSGAWGHVNVDQIAVTNAVPAEFSDYDRQALNFGELALTLVGEGAAMAQWEGRDEFIRALGQPGVPAVSQAEASLERPLVGAVTSRFALPASESRTVTFVVSWYFPNLHTEHGVMYSNWFDGAGDVARQLAANLEQLRQDTLLFCDTYYEQTTLPRWLVARLMMPVSTLATGTSQWWKNGRFWAWEGVGCCAGTCTHVWNYAQAHAWLFPELARSTRSLQDLCDGFDGKTGLVGFRSNRAYAADGQASTVLKCYREHRNSANLEFLRLHWPRIKLALEYLIEQDANADGIIENSQHNTFDINFVGPNTFVGSLYLAALRAGEQMALLMNEPHTAQRYQAIHEAGSKWTAENLFNGEYFEQRLPAASNADWQYGSGCLSDQVFGQNWAHQLDLGYVYPVAQVRDALRAVFKYNWALDVGPYNEEYPPERWFAQAEEPGLFVCTWPRGGRPEKPVRYRDEVWTGSEYQVAAGMTWEGLLDEALLVVQSIEQRYDGTRHNPWNEVECGDHYARALASWGVLQALETYTYDGPAGRLGFAPRIRPEKSQCFFSAARGWGTLGQKRQRRYQENSIHIKWGELRLTVLSVARPAGIDPEQVRAQAGVRLGDDQLAWQKLAVEVQQHADHYELHFAEPLTLRAGWRLDTVLTW
ncbi:MAG: hypothetical protein KKB50_03115 [Planctomycetes bacterium]|nr:hypothetical protein [Planctomycetota bacterium]